MSLSSDRLIVTIDGPAGAGKTTLARKMAGSLEWTYLDTGAMYRAVGVAAFESGTAAEDEKGLADLVQGLDLRVKADSTSTRIFLGEREITGEIRAHHISGLASRVSAHRVVREAMVDLQRRIGRKGRIVAEGRDMGTVVFPEAGAKFFLIASVEERGRRRYEELLALGQEAALDSITQDIAARDQADSSRALSPLVPASDAVIVDSTGLSPDEVLEIMIEAVSKKIGMKLKRKY